ncbi:hypothetical protein BOX15_Mlig021706g1 [Macrostomum lignano]|uniref:Uncharacterized protein n=2 Tax=Macrostomum lignano TaxID=282301 RepID=A0A1I8GKY4_9PLAT|nr:hypothetical protein BOX15_Mlig021706g1 [Macrostomum lignano]
MDILRSSAKAILARINGTGLGLRRLETLRDHPYASLNQKANLTANNLASTGDFISVLDVYPVSTKASVFTESFAYPLRNLFSDLGGILGLWVGVSIITLLELLELVIQLVQLAALRLKTVSEMPNQKVHSWQEDKHEGPASDIRHSTIVPKLPVDQTADLQLHVALPPKPPPGSTEQPCPDFVVRQPSWFERIFSF